MILALPVVLALAQQCAPGVAPEAMLSLVQVESRFDPLAINVNRVGRINAVSVSDAVAKATKWIAAGYSVDLGIAQVNSRNLRWSGISIAQAFEPCANLTASAKILAEDYAHASLEASGIDAISRTFSMYNTGNTIAGFRNNYVARVWSAASQLVPGVTPPGQTAAAAGPSSGAANLPSSKPASAWVTGPADTSVLVFK